MLEKNLPKLFEILISNECINKSDILQTSDGFFMVYKSLSNILLEKNIVDFPDSSNERFLCDRFFDDWFLYAVSNEYDYTYSLLKLREQEHDIEGATPADGDITVCFSSKKCSASDGPVTVELHSEFKDCDAEDHDSFEIGNNWSTYWYTFTKDGSEASLFFTTESDGALRVLIDDIIVMQESTEREVSVGTYETTATAYTFTGLTDSKYRYRVRAKDSADAGITSVYSPKAEIVLGGNTGISSPDDEADAVIEVYSLSGVSIYKGAESECPRLAPGIYVVRRNGKSEKVIIK